MEDLPAFANAGILGEYNLVYAAADTVTYNCNDNFTPEPGNSLPTCTCSQHSNDPSTASWTCEPTSFTDACQPVSNNGRFYTVQRTIYLMILGLFNSTENYNRTKSMSLTLGVKIIIKKITVCCLGCTVSSLPSYANAVPQVATGIDIYNVGDVVDFVCNENFAAIEAFLGCTCIDDSTGNGVSWECNPAANANANVEVCEPRKYRTNVMSRLFAQATVLAAQKKVKQPNYNVSAQY